MTRVIIYDASGAKPDLELSDTWWLGARLFKALRRADHIIEARAWGDVVEGLRQFSRVDEVQYWGHGSPGNVWLGNERLGADVLARLPAIGTLWLRTCSTFHGAAGQTFAEWLAMRTRARVAGHTYIIGPWQSGLRTLRPGAVPDWKMSEGRGRGDDGRIAWSGPLQPRTVTCLHAEIPRGW
jgi:hypothetical protein